MDTPITEEKTQIETAPVKSQRRRYSKQFKQQVIDEILGGRESVSVIARRHDLNANLVFKWKREYQRRVEPKHEPNDLIPVAVRSSSPSLPSVLDASRRIEIELPTGERISLYDEASVASLQTVLLALRT